MGDPKILAAGVWPENGDLIVACEALGYLDADWPTLDPTYGRGVWWKRWRPRNLVTNDLDPSKATDHHFDYRQIELPDASFRAITFDPPYVAPGGRKTSTAPEFNDRYGLVETPATPTLLQVQNDAGLAEMFRLVEPGGFVLAKCKNYVWSGKWFGGVHRTEDAGLALGFTIQDEFVHASKGSGMQPPRTRADGAPVRQHHASNNYSTLIVFRRPPRIGGRRRSQPTLDG